MKSFAQNIPLERILIGLLSAKREEKLAYMAGWRAQNPTRRREWTEANREHVQAYEKAYLKKNAQRKRETRRKWRASNRERVNDSRRAWAKAHPESVRSTSRRVRAKMLLRPDFFLRKRVSKLLQHYVKGKCGRSTPSIVGCDVLFLRKWIESQFLPGMSFENRSEWHVDHIFPVTCCGPEPDQILAAQHYRNLRPMWDKENRQKNDRIGEDSLIAAFLCGIHTIHITRPHQITVALVELARNSGFEVVWK